MVAVRQTQHVQHDEPNNIRRLLRTAVREQDILKRAEKYEIVVDSINNLLKIGLLSAQERSKATSLELRLIERVATHFVASDKHEMALRVLDKSLKVARELKDHERSGRIESKGRRIGELLQLKATGGAGRL